MSLADRANARKKAKQETEKQRIAEQGDGTARLAKGLSLGAVRSLTGTIQGASGLYDLATPGKGTNRFSKKLDKVAKGIDEEAEGSTGYQAAQMLTDIAQLVGTGGAAAATKTGVKAAEKVASKSAKIAAKGGAKNKIKAKALESIASPSNAASEVGYNLSQVGQDESKDMGINRDELLLNIGGGVAAGGLAGAAGVGVSKVKGRVAENIEAAKTKAAGTPKTEAETLRDTYPTYNEYTANADSGKPVAPTISPNETALQRRARERVEARLGGETQIFDNPVDEATSEIPAFLRKNPKARKAYEDKKTAENIVTAGKDYDSAAFNTTYKDRARNVVESTNPKVQSAIADAYKASGSEDMADLAIDAVVKTRDKSIAKTLIDNLLPNVDTQTRKQLVKQAITHDKEGVKKLIHQYDTAKPGSIEDLAPKDAAMNALNDVDLSGDLEGLGGAMARPGGNPALAGIDVEGNPMAALDALNGTPRVQAITAADVPQTTPGITQALEAVAPSKVINENELNTLWDYADYLTGGYPMKGSEINQLTRQARNAADTAGIDITSGTPVEITDRISQYSSGMRQAKDPNFTTQPMAIAKPPTMQTLVDTPEGMQSFDDVKLEGELSGVGPDDTPTNKGAQYIADEVNQQKRDLSIGLQDVDSEIAKKLTTGDAKVKLTKKDDFYLWLGKHFQDSQSFLANALGKPGADLMNNFANATHFKSKVINDLNDNIAQFDKKIKKLAGGSNEGRVQVWNRIANALDDRANPNKYLLEGEQELYDRAVVVFDEIKRLRRAAGLNTLEDYSPWHHMAEYSKPPEYLAEAVTSKNVSAESKFSKERMKAEREDLPTDVNLYSYVSSQLNEMAYLAPIQRFKEDLANLSAGVKANPRAVNEAIDYVNKIVQDAIRPPAGGVSAKVMNNVYRNILRFNLKLAIQNTTQRLLANNVVSKEAQRLAKELPDDLRSMVRNGTDGRGGLSYGDSTILSDIAENELPKGKSKKINDWLDKLDFYAKSESKNVTSSFDKGVAQAITDSEVYKSAIRGGADKIDAARLALADDTVREVAVRHGNTIVNNTQFGSNALSKPLVLRNNGQTLLGIPLKTFTMFTRFPIGMSQNILETLGAKNARALDVLRRADPRASTIPEMRKSYGALQNVMEDSLKAVKAGLKTDIPENVLKEQIAIIKSNINIIDKELEKFSNITTKGGVKSLAKMWTAAATIQFVYNGGLGSEDPTNAYMGALIKSDPTAIGRVLGPNSPLLGTKSSLSPVQSNFGETGINEKALANFLPGVGAVSNRATEANKWVSALNGQ